jgi:hypothetical protein
MQHIANSPPKSKPRPSPQLTKSATIVRFPPRRAAAIFVCKERNSDEWLAIARGHGWSFSSRAEALNEAEWLACNLALPIREIVP